MKKSNILVFFSLFIFFSCKGIPDETTTVPLPKSPNGWKLGVYVDSSGKTTGEIFVIYEDVIPAFFSNANEKNIAIGLQRLRISKSNGISFLHRRFENPDIKENGSIDINVFVNNSKNIEKKFVGNNYYSSLIRMDYSDELFNDLSVEKAIMRFEIPNVYVCEFNVPPSFKEAYEYLLDAEENKVQIVANYSKQKSAESRKSKINSTFDIVRSIMPILLIIAIFAFL